MISVVICTYNRCDSLKVTLDSILNQELDRQFDYELIVVDNNSKDRTTDTVDSYKKRFSGRLRYTFEAKQGLSHARNRGIRESKGQIIVFTDDDCLPEKEWLKKIFFQFNANPCLDGVLGGAIWENGKNVYQDSDNILRGNGLNMSFRRSIFENAGQFECFLGAGSVGASAEDVEFVYRVLRKNKKVLILNDIKVIHKHRISNNQKEIIKNRNIEGKAVFWLKYAILCKDRFALKNIYWDASSFMNRPFEYFLEGRFITALRKIVNLIYFCKGLVMGLYIWVFLFQMQTKTKSKRFYSNIY